MDDMFWKDLLSSFDDDDDDDIQIRLMNRLSLKSMLRVPSRSLTFNSQLIFYITLKFSKKVKYANII